MVSAATTPNDGTTGPEADLYVAKKQSTNSDLLPFDWYNELAIEGARELLPSGYIDTIDAVSSIPDPRRP